MNSFVGKEKEINMNLTLVLREEFVCLLVLFFLTFYHAYYNCQLKGKVEDDYFLRLSILGISHVIFDIITLFTVNYRTIVPETLNKWFHVCFYFTGMLFIAEFLGYVIKLTLSYRILRGYRKFMYVPHFIIFILTFFLPIEYIDGDGISYSYGPMVFACYGTFLLYCVICILLAVVRFGEIDKKTRIAVLPVSALMIMMVIFQAVNPELLMTSAGITFVCIGLFVTVNNPVDIYAKEALWDDATGLHNKNSYQKLMNMLQKKYENKNAAIGFIVCDLNGLKLINDNFGHVEGDKLIKAAGQVLLEGLETAYNVYRVGGDEFTVVYHSPNEETMKAEIQKVRQLCEAYQESPVPLSIAMGYAIDTCKADGFDELYKKADALMYEDKKRIKAEHPEFIRN